MILSNPYKKPKADYSKVTVLSEKVKNLDPTRTTSLRNAFVRDMDRRFNQLKSLIKQAIIDQDVFGLNTPQHVTTFAANINTLPGNKAFAFSRSSEKVDAFMLWLNEQEKKGIIQTVKLNQLGTAAEEPWTNTYIADSYKRGQQRATYEMGKTGMVNPLGMSGLTASMSTPFHVDRVGLLYTRTFSDLKGISQAMDTQISRILAQGLTDGDNPKVLAKKITDSVDGIGRARARTLARTEVIRAHHSGMVGEYRNWGLAGVKVKAEWQTAGFNVCDRCKELEGKIFTIDQIEGMIPLHPNCRCISLPYVDEGETNKSVDKNKQ